MPALSPGRQSPPDVVRGGGGGAAATRGYIPADPSLNPGNCHQPVQYATETGRWWVPELFLRFSLSLHYACCPVAVVSQMLDHLKLDQ